MVMKNTVGLNIGLLAAQKSTKSSGNGNRHFRLIAYDVICCLLMNISLPLPVFSTK